MAQFGKGYAKRSTPSYFMSIVGVSLVLILLGLLGWIVINANKLGQNFKENLEVQVYLRENLSPKDSASLVEYIAAQPYTKSYKFMTKDLAKQQFMADGNTDWAGILDKNPLPASVDFKIRSEYANLDSLNKVKTDLSQNISVSEVHFNKVLVSNLSDMIRRVSIILLAVAVAISIAVIILIDNTIRLAMFSNRFLIKTMQMVGATRGLLPAPWTSGPLSTARLPGSLPSGLSWVSSLSRRPGCCRRSGH